MAAALLVLPMVQAVGVKQGMRCGWCGCSGCALGVALGVEAPHAYRQHWQWRSCSGKSVTHCSWQAAHCLHTWGLTVDLLALIISVGAARLLGCGFGGGMHVNVFRQCVQSHVVRCTAPRRKQPRRCCGVFGRLWHNLSALLRLGAFCGAFVGRRLIGLASDTLAVWEGGWFTCQHHMCRLQGLERVKPCCHVTVEQGAVGTPVIPPGGGSESGGGKAMPTWRLTRNGCACQWQSNALSYIASRRLHCLHCATTSQGYPNCCRPTQAPAWLQLILSITHWPITYSSTQ